MNRRSWLLASAWVVGLVFAKDLDPPFDATSRLMMQDKGLVFTGCTISKNGRGFWCVQMHSTTYGTSTTFPKGTTKDEIIAWAKKFEKCIGLPVKIK